MYDAEKLALEEYILGSIENRNDRALKIALLTRDVMPTVANQIVHKFLRTLDHVLGEKYNMPPATEMPSANIEKWGLIGWRSSQWGKGWIVGLEFKPELSYVEWGFKAPNVRAKDVSSDSFDFIDDKLRSAIQIRLREIPSRGRILGESDKWPLYFGTRELQKSDDTSRLLKVAGFEQHEGMPLVDWFADEMALVYRTVDEVISARAS
ncbi:hypothetical protein KKP04_02135 [Rhodomicrobium sp. Az07]|uniref:hypothetical protein n=1 Tax=Rhodomicrobium sp. Az07 TaxID=2839034 RepID=UPI001BE4ED92|nr:hypothetical protein [Rhodomicrobium sp. Az07]MBT3069670.1 hypothetical protein [Rhodomicrobium sp. Az07]